MQSVIQKKYCGSVRTFWLDKELLERKLNEAMKMLLRERPEICDAVLFGSFAEGKACVGSDLDILLIVEDSNERFIDRAIKYRDYFNDIDLGVDIFVYTKKERDEKNMFVQNALLKGRHFS